MARRASGAGATADNDNADLEQSLGELGLEQYLTRFLQAGFNTWETLADISEDDLAALNVRLGHRRKLQREIARRRRSWPDYRPLPTPSHLIQSLPTPPTSTLGSIRESVEVNFYSLANKTHSISQWSQETSQAYGASNGTRTLSDGYGMRLRVIDLLQAGDADFQSAVSTSRRNAFPPLLTLKSVSDQAREPTSRLPPRTGASHSARPGEQRNSSSMDD
jgi:hypothetical protein